MIQSLIRTNPPNLDSLGLGFHIHELNLSELDIIQNNNSILFKLSTGVKQPTKRFWLSLASRTGTGSNIFKHFSHKEVFKRLADNKTLEAIRVVEDVSTEELLAISSLDKPIIPYTSAVAILEKHKGYHMTYHDGVIRSWHIMPGGAPFKIFDEKYTPLMLVEIPIDAYGSVNIYTGCLRHSTGARIVPYSSQYKTQIAIGKSNHDANDALNRALYSYSNDEAIDLLAKRLYAATKSILSVNEYLKINTELAPILAYDVHKRDAAFASLLTQTRFNQIIGNVNKAYGITSTNDLTIKERVALPTACRVSEVINFVTELCSFCMNDIVNIPNIINIYNLVGQLISNDYDLENLLPKNKKSKDPHVAFYFSKDE